MPESLLAYLHYHKKSIQLRLLHIPPEFSMEIDYNYYRHARAR